MKEYIVHSPKDKPCAIEEYTSFYGEPIKELVRCKDCKHFELDYVDREAMGIPLITAHEICMRWGNGCKTSPDGYCFMAEKRGEEE